ncbi:MAG: hypothetical protein J6M90_00510 [Oscillospiraceae bacterium]|nr:hypothetical protein [Oscillospiraceae bacterium]
MTKYLNTSDELINRITSGDSDAIIAGIQDNSPIVQLNALIYGTKAKIQNSVFVNSLKSLIGSRAVFFGVPMEKYVLAALDVLGVQNYQGDDDFVLRLIHSDFQIV